MSTPSTSSATPSTTQLLTNTQQINLRQITLPKKLEISTRMLGFENEIRCKQFIQNIIDNKKQFNNITTVLRGISPEQITQESASNSESNAATSNASSTTELNSVTTTPTHAENENALQSSSTSIEAHIDRFNQQIHATLRCSLQHGYNLTTPARLFYHSLKDIFQDVEGRLQSRVNCF